MGGFRLKEMNSFEWLLGVAMRCPVGGLQMGGCDATVGGDHDHIRRRRRRQRVWPNSN